MLYQHIRSSGPILVISVQTASTNIMIFLSCSITGVSKFSCKFNFEVGRGGGYHVGMGHWG